jgi:hypothetical protein
MYQLNHLHPSHGKRAITFEAIPTSPKKVILVFPPMLTKARMGLAQGNLTLTTLN